MNKQTIRKSSFAVTGAVVAGALLLSACGADIRAERKGKKAG